ncbi:caspase domain-containing protein [Tribonema minus]|uniref:Caspase domain-containing protein n=1 Tax=Tribonema minus TaxID=303371 RepID=A0A835YJR3_9STRA|nr:caspase domain-containing protein [Tribonema minus]
MCTIPACAPASRPAAAPAAAAAAAAGGAAAAAAYGSSAAHAHSSTAHAYPVQAATVAYPVQGMYPQQGAYPTHAAPAAAAVATSAVYAPQRYPTNPYDPEYAQQADQAIGANVRMIAACQDSQTAADVQNVASYGVNVGGAGGACTNALLRSIQQGPTSWIGILRRMQAVLKERRLNQVPQLSTSKLMDLNTPFSLMRAAPGGRHRSLLIGSNYHSQGVSCGNNYTSNTTGKLNTSPVDMNAITMPRMRYVCATGINYRGQRGELRGCHSDVETMRQYILTQGYTQSAQTMCVLMDDGQHSPPTHANILAAFSGHGGRVKDKNGDEADGYDETIVPVDFQRAGQIIDDDIHKMIVKPLPHGVEFTICMDCCHSGTVIDLPYSLSVDDRLVHAMDQGQMPQLQPNPGFSFARRLLGVGVGMALMSNDRPLLGAMMMGGALRGGRRFV